MERALTVGLDGSPESLAAARWAAEEAQRRDLNLRLVHAWPQLAPEPTSVPSEIDHNYWAKRIAALLVVGRRKHRRHLTPRLGPVAQAAVHHARSPVTVVPHD